MNPLRALLVLFATPRPAPGSRIRLALALLCALVALGMSRPAAAHASGEASEGCAGCHGGGMVPTVTITSDQTLVNLGQMITLTISISQTNGPVAGFYLQADGPGTLSIVDSGTKLAGSGVTHTQPRTGSGGETTFKVGWTAPNTPGGVDFWVWANSANGDGKSGGDGEGDAFFSTAFGCSGIKYYHDYDGDGFGAVSSGYTMNCSLPQYYSLSGADCDDNDEHINPSAPEICDGKDNNCNGQIDENLPIITYCTDADGDGHGVSGQQTMMGCKPAKGFGLCDNDCNDHDPTIYPGAPELCNNVDDNCNGRVDENARVICGVGWCARYGEGCTTQCTPGAPRAEQCNAFDDDCDGVIDNGTDLQLCGKPGFACRNGTCVADADAGANTGTNIGNASGGTSTGTGGSASMLAASDGDETSGNSSSQRAVGYCAFGAGRASRPFAFAGLIGALAFGLRRGRRKVRARRRLAPG